MRKYEYRCDECGETMTVGPTVKEQLDMDGTLLADCTGSGCTGSPKRVWGAAVTTASVEGFYANSRHGKET